MSLRTLFTNNYEYLSVVAKRITRKKDINMADDLISETYISIASKEVVVPESSEEFVKWFSKWMKNCFEWSNSSFNRLYKPKEELIVDHGFNEKSGGDRTGKRFVTPGDGIIRVDECLEDEEALRDLELFVEETNEATKELIEISSSLGKIKTLRYIELVEFKRQLPEYEALLFELYYEKDLSTRVIAEMYSDETHKMNYQSVNKMINKIKDKINKRWR